MRGVFLHDNSVNGCRQTGDEETDNNINPSSSEGDDEEQDTDATTGMQADQGSSTSSVSEDDAEVETKEETKRDNLLLESLPRAKTDACEKEQPFIQESEETANDDTLDIDGDDYDGSNCRRRVHQESHAGRHFPLSDHDINNTRKRRKRVKRRSNPLLPNKKPRNESSPGKKEEDSFIKRNGSSNHPGDDQHDNELENQFTRKASNSFIKSEESERVHDVFSILFSSIQSLVDFSLNVPIFKELPPLEQESLLRSGVLDMLLLSSAFLHIRCGKRCGASENGSSDSSATRFWARMTLSSSSVNEKTSKNEATMSPPASPTFSSFKNVLSEKSSLKVTSKAFPRLLSINSIKCLVKEDDLLRKHWKLFEIISSLDLDEVSIILVSLILLMNPDRISMSSQESIVSLVSSSQESLLTLLKSFLKWRYGPEAAASIFRRILLMLPDLKELSDTLTDYPLSFCSEDIKKVNDRINGLAVNNGLGVSDHDTPSLQVVTPEKSSWTLLQDVLPPHLLDPSSLSSPSSTSTSSLLPSSANMTRVEYVSDHSSSSESSYRSEDKHQIDCNSL